LAGELVLLLEQENWRLALGALQAWGGLSLLDATLQRDRHWARRLHWARRFDLPPLLALIAAAGDPVALAERLRLPQRQGALLPQLGELRSRLAAGALRQDLAAASPWDWCQLLEAPGLSPEAVALALACGLAPRRPLLRWLLRWRRLGPEVSARDLLASGMTPGPQVGERLRRSRKERLDREPP
jgi:poly(A) polymerase